MIQLTEYAAIDDPNAALEIIKGGKYAVPTGSMLKINGVGAGYIPPEI
jgi:hypothetical protein